MGINGHEGLFLNHLPAVKAHIIHNDAFHSFHCHDGLVSVSFFVDLLHRRQQQI
jgi:hypothetical protein